MGKLILDDDLRAKLNGLNEAVEVCDPSGKTVGHFIPDDLYMKFLMAWAKVEFSTPEAARERAESLAEYRAGKGLTTAEAIAYLKSLRPGEDGG